MAKGSARATDDTAAQEAVGPDTGSGAPEEQPEARPARRLPRYWWAWAGALAVAAVALFFCYVRTSGTVPDGSDGADQVLQAWDMLHGNWLLRGWTVGDVSYYTTELPEYILVELVKGLGTDVVHISAAITYTLLVLLAGWAAKGRATGREGLVRALIAAGILLAPQLDGGVSLLIQQPDHIGTNVPLLVVFIVLDRAPRRWYTPVAITVMLGWVLVADRAGVFTAAVPLVVVGAVRAFWSVVRHGKRLGDQWFELSLIGAGIVAFGGAELVVAVIKHLGGYTSLSLPSVQTKLGTLPSHVRLAAIGFLKLYGADATGTSGVTAAFAVIHLAGLALAVWAILLAFRRFFSSTDLIVPVMATGIVVNLAAYILSTVPDTWFDSREMAAVLPFGAVLAGRLLAAPLAGPLNRRARLTTPVLAGLLACYLAALGYGAAQPTVSDSEQPVVAFLEAHHLTHGLGTYTESNVLTLDSGGRVWLYTVSWRVAGAVPRDYESDASWYNPKLHDANFVLTNAGDGGGTSLIPVRQIIELGGQPAHVYRYQTFTIYVFNHNLLADLGRTPNSTPGNVP